MLKKDSYITGLIIGILIPSLVIITSLGINLFLSDKLEDSTIFMLCLAINIVVFRIYIKTKKMTQTGQAILALSFIATIIYFIFFYNKSL